ncbi:MAG: hypothetical protein JWP97_4402 [Labilithrix sp.]|nr:hypothetical protein [Labilithrix sp.]
MSRHFPRVFAAAPLLLALACASGPTPAAPPACDQLCLDGVAVAGLRLTLKQVFNATVQGGPAGAQDERYTCPLGGTAHVFGTATANAIQGATEVDLTYELEGCVLFDRDTEPKQNYRLASTGTVHQKGTLAVQPTATTAIGIQSEAVSIAGTVYDPPVPYDQQGCALVGSQNGNRLTGTVCGRDFATDL